MSKPADQLIVIADSPADWAAAKLAKPAGPEVMDRLFEARTTPGVILIGGPRYGKTMAANFLAAKRVGPVTL